MLKSVVRSTWEHHEVGAELKDALQSLHCGLVYERPAVSRECNRPIDDVIDRLCFQTETGLLGLILAQLHVTA